MYFSEIPFMSPEYDEAVALRNDILRKPLKLEFSVDQLEDEKDQIHLGVYGEDQVLLGCLTLKPIDETSIKMKQVAILEIRQRSGLGRKLVRFSEAWALRNGFFKMELHARDLAVPFYNKLGYKVEGEGFTEVGIMHYKMSKLLNTSNEAN